MTATNTIKASYLKYRGHCGGFPSKTLETNTTIEYITRNDVTELVLVASLDKGSRMITFIAYTFSGDTVANKSYKLTKHQLYYFDGLLDGSIEQS